jgi:hypothetical protein
MIYFDLIIKPIMACGFECEMYLMSFFNVQLKHVTDRLFFEYFKFTELYI